MHLTINKLATKILTKNTTLGNSKTTKMKNKQIKKNIFLRKLATTQEKIKACFYENLRQPKNMLIVGPY